MLSYLKDKDFLRALDNENNKFYWVKIEVLDMNEHPVRKIEGKVQTGSSISINGDSAVRRTCNISFIAEDNENDLTNVDNLLSINKRIKIYEGIENNINSNYPDIVWFPLGVYVINQPSITHNESGCLISLSCQDKMCLLNGTLGGNLPASITFDHYEQQIGLQKMDVDPALIEETETFPNSYTIYAYGNPTKYKSWTKEGGWHEEDDDSAVGTYTRVPQRIYDIIQTLVVNYGGEAISKVFINDIPLEIKQIVRYVGSGSLYYNTNTGFYTTDDSYLTEEGVWRTYEFNEDVGYVYTDFVYPTEKELITNIGDNVCSVLETIKNLLGNYEYFYDIDGNFVFQEIRNYLNNSYDPVDKYRLDNNRRVEIEDNKLNLINGANYKVDYYSNTKSVYTFTEGNGLISSYSNTPNYSNLKNDFHIWGENVENGMPIHYHLVLKEKPVINENEPYKVIYLTDEEGKYTGGLRLATEDEDGEDYVPEDPRAELYLRGLTKWKNQQRPDVYEQELLDLFDIIYDFKEKKFKSDITNRPNDLRYFFDFLEPIDNLYNVSVDVINERIYSYQQENVKRLYNNDIPNMIMINTSLDSATYQHLVDRCEREGQPFSNIDSYLYDKLAIGTWGYTAQEVARSLLYQYTNYNESISLQVVPIYYLDVNSRITVQDRKSGIYGDYIIHSISIPLGAESTMSITASRALERI